MTNWSEALAPEPPGDRPGQGRLTGRAGTRGWDLFVAQSGCRTTWARAAPIGKWLRQASPEKIASGRACSGLAFWLLIFRRGQLRGSVAAGQLGYTVCELRLFCIPFSKSPSLYSSTQGVPFLAKAPQVFDYGEVNLFMLFFFSVFMCVYLLSPLIRVFILTCIYIYAFLSVA